MMKNFSLLLAFLFLSVSLYAQITLPIVLSDHMVLQQGKKVNIWGKAQPHEVVTIRFQKQAKRITADQSGDWAVKLDELVATYQPQTLTIQSRSDKKVLNDILIGEVWLASGQSNLEYSMNEHPRYAKPMKGNPNILKEAYEATSNPLIRMLYVEKVLNSDTLPSKGWQQNSQESLASISAAAYFFAQSLVDSLNVPVGIISSSWGGTPIETWTPGEGERYKKMIESLVPYTLKGFLWYQGENNLSTGDMDNYATKQRMLVDRWRSAWDDYQLPFYYVQLAPYLYSQNRNAPPKTWESLPRFWEVQTSFLTTPYTGMVVTTDLVDNVRDIHPSYKWIIGKRFARIALAKAYGRSHLVYSGPTYKRMTITNEEVILEFDHIGSGLATRNGEQPNWFQLKEGQGEFRRVEAEIMDNKIVIKRSNSMLLPVVRFAWDEVAMPNLCNKEGLPALSFRTAVW